MPPIVISAYRATQVPLPATTNPFSVQPEKVTEGAPLTLKGVCNEQAPPYCDAMCPCTWVITPGVPFGFGGGVSVSRIVSALFAWYEAVAQ